MREESNAFMKKFKIICLVNSVTFFFVSNLHNLIMNVVKGEFCEWVYYLMIPNEQSVLVYHLLRKLSKFCSKSRCACFSPFKVNDQWWCFTVKVQCILMLGSVLALCNVFKLVL